MVAICVKCGVDMKYQSVLVRHVQRKTPCSPIVAAVELPTLDQQKDHVCKFCGRAFTTKTSMCRHVRTRCKIAGSDEGMDRLLEHTLQRQLAEQSAQIAELTTLLKNQLISPAAQQSPAITQQIIGNVAQMTNIQNVINIHPWDGDRRIAVDVGHVTAAFAENSRLREYTALGDHAMADPEIAPPYVTELLMDLTKRAHATPESRNIYMNPRRADQVLVHMRSGRWEVLSLLDATREIFDGVAKDIRMIIITREICACLPTEAQNALGLAGLMYEYEPDEYAKLARASMSAHLANTCPQPRIGDDSGSEAAAQRGGAKGGEAANQSA